MIKLFENLKRIKTEKRKSYVHTRLPYVKIKKRRIKFKYVTLISEVDGDFFVKLKILFIKYDIKEKRKEIDRLFWNQNY